MSPRRPRRWRCRHRPTGWRPSRSPLPSPVSTIARVDEPAAVAASKAAVSSWAVSTPAAFMVAGSANAMTVIGPSSLTLIFV